MILVLVGTHPQPFDRLLKKIDVLIESGAIIEKVIAQIGASNYTPKNYAHKSFFNDVERFGLIKKSSLVITHAGAGNIIDCLNSGKKVIVVPRRKKFGEHTNDHQLELAEALESAGKVIVVYDIEKLGDAIRKKIFKPRPNNKSMLTKKIERYAEKVVR